MKMPIKSKKCQKCQENIKNDIKKRYKMSEEVKNMQKVVTMSKVHVKNTKILAK